MRTFKKYLVSLVSAAMVLGTLASTAPASAATVASAPFSDVTSSTSYANAINFLAAEGVISGTGNGQFQPSTPVTRAEMAKILVNLAGKGAVANSLSSMTPQFTDASSIPTWAWGYVNAAVAMGVIKGYPDGTFRANNNVTDAEAMAMFTRVLGDDWSVTGAWPNNYILAGFNLGIASGLNNESANVPALRGEIAQMAYNTALSADYTIVNNNGTNTLSNGGGLYTKNGTTSYPEVLVGTASNVSANSITVTPTSGPASTYGFEANVVLIGATALNSSLDGASVTAIIDSNDLVNALVVSAVTTAAADTLNSVGQGTSNFTLPTGYSLPATNTAQYYANQSCFVQNAGASVLVGGGYNPNWNANTGTGESCNPNNKYAHVVVVQDGAGNNYLLMKDGKTLEYGPSTTITINGVSEGNLTGNEWRDLIPGATITATLTNGLASAITETYGYDANLVTSVNPVSGVITFTEGTATVYYINASNATVTLNGQPSTLSAIQPNDDIKVRVTPPTPMPAQSSLFGATLGASNANNAVPVAEVDVTRNTVSGTITSTSTSTINLPWTGAPYTSVTFTLQPSSGNAVTLTTDGDQPSAQNASLQNVNNNVTVVLDASGGVLYVLSTSASAIPVAMITGTGSSQTIVNGAVQTNITLTGIAGSSATTYNEAPNGSGISGGNFACVLDGSACANGQPTTLTNGFDNFWALTMNNAGQVAQATYLDPVPTNGDTLKVVSASSSSVVIEAVTAAGNVDTSFNPTINGNAVGFSNGYLTVTNGTAFSGVTSEKYIGFGGLQANDVVNLYFVPAPGYYPSGGSNPGTTPTYAIVDTYR